MELYTRIDVMTHIKWHNTTLDVVLCTDFSAPGTLKWELRYIYQRYFASELSIKQMDREFFNIFEIHLNPQINCKDAKSVTNQ